MFMGVRSILFKKFFSDRVLIKIIDNIFLFSNLTLDRYFSLVDYNRRLFFLKNSLLSIGIGYRAGDPLNAERWFVKTVLADIYSVDYKWYFFDVGANVGDYSKLLSLNFKKSHVYSFEPNPITFNVLKENLNSFSNIVFINKAVSKGIDRLDLFTYRENKTSGHASLEKEVFDQLYLRNDLEKFKVSAITLNLFTQENYIPNIDFIKIDTEGHEMDVLLGGLSLLKENKISIIQFEFNEMNIVKRIFLKDFFQLLTDYTMFRISDGKLIPLGNYKSEYEIFWYQDILAVLKSKTFILDKLLKYQDS
jgi:FkbM family methyltransferase